MTTYIWPQTPSSMPAGAATEAKQDAEIALLTTLNAKDFATQTTLAGVKSDTASLVAKDFATATNQTSTNSKLDTLNAKDFATQTTLAAAKTVLDTISTSVAPGNSRIQTPVLVDGSTIQASSGSRILAATLSGNVKRIRVSDTTGLFIGVYDAVAAGTLLHIINPGFDGYIDQSFTNGTTLYFISMTTDAGTSGSYVALNFLG